MLITFLDGSQREVVLTAGANLRNANLSGAYVRDAPLP